MGSRDHDTHRIPVKAYPYLIKAAKDAGDEDTLKVLHQKRWDAGVRNQEDTGLYLLREYRRLNEWGHVMEILFESKQGVVRDSCGEFFEPLGLSTEELFRLRDLGLKWYRIDNRVTSLGQAVVFLLKFGLKCDKIIDGCPSHNAPMFMFSKWRAACYFNKFYGYATLTFQPTRGYRSYRVLALRVVDGALVFRFCRVDGESWNPSLDLYMEIFDTLGKVMSDFSSKEYTGADLYKIAVKDGACKDPGWKEM